MLNRIHCSQAMSFGQKLANKAQAVRKRHCEWVEETLNNFMKGCEFAAKEGDYHHKMHAYVPDRARDEASALLKQKLAELGFTDAGAKLAFLGMNVNVEVWAEWNMPAKAPGKSQATPQGIRGKCPICQETRHLVALMPCGHTLCTQQCHVPCIVPTSPVSHVP